VSPTSCRSTRPSTPSGPGLRRLTGPSRLRRDRSGRLRRARGSVVRWSGPARALRAPDGAALTASRLRLMGDQRRAGPDQRTTDPRARRSRPERIAPQSGRSSPSGEAPAPKGVDGRVDRTGRWRHAGPLTSAIVSFGGPSVRMGKRAALSANARSAIDAAIATFARVTHERHPELTLVSLRDVGPDRSVLAPAAWKILRPFAAPEDRHALLRSERGNARAPRSPRRLSCRAPAFAPRS